MPHDVFISHSAQDKVVADAVCATLEAKKIRCWITPRDIIPGRSWGEAIVDAINESRVMVVIFSSHSNNSRQVIREIEQAVKRGVTILPLRIEDAPMSKDMDYFLSSVHWLDALTPPMEKHFNALADTVNLLLGTSAQPAPSSATVPPASQTARKPIFPGWKVALPILVVLVLAVLIGGWYLSRGNKTRTDNQTGPSPTTTSVTSPRPVPESTTKVTSPGQPSTSPPQTTKPVPAVDLSSLKDQLVIDLGGGVTMEFVLMRPGSFLMGSDKSRFPDEKPVHKVTITKPFYLGKYEVTQEQWQAVMGTNPSEFKGERNPVEQVSWEDCQDFVAKLKDKVSGVTPSLPTEAQWEYACLAGSAGDYCYGDGDANLGEYAWFSSNSAYTTHPVGEKKPNAWGLYDMHGNVWEWCKYAYESYVSGHQTDPAGSSSGSSRVLRGGSWGNDAEGSRAAIRFNVVASYRGKDYGFGVRLALDFP